MDTTIRPILLLGSHPTCEVCKQIKTVDLCEHCRSFAFCDDCKSNYTDRHRRYCTPLKHCLIECEYFESAALEDVERSNPRAQLFGDTDIDVEWRRTNRHAQSFFRKVCERDMLKLIAYGTTRLQNYMTKGISDRLEVVRNLGGWRLPHLKMMLPAIYICQGRDQEAYDFIMWFAHNANNPHVRSLRKHPFHNPEYKLNDVLETAAGVGENDADFWMFRVPLLLIKARALLDLVKLEGNVGWLESKSLAEKVEFLNPHFTGQIIRIRPDVLQSNRETIRRHMKSLSADVRTLMQFPEKGNNKPWDTFWELMLRSGHNIIDFGPENMPVEMRDLIIANYHSWLHTPNAIKLMEVRFLNKN